MTVKVSKPAINVREELADLKKPTGIAGQAMLAAETPQEQQALLGFGRRNVLINGDMRVAQRGTSSAGLGVGATVYLLDRFSMETSGTAGRFTASQASDGPAGFGKSLKIDCTTADTSVAAGELFLLQQRIEGYNVQSFGKGTPDCTGFTVSFYCKGNASATYTLELYDSDNNRSISREFSVSSAWERVVINFPPDTTGTFNCDNGVSLYCQIWLHAGSTWNGGTLNEKWSGVPPHNTRASSNQSSIFDSTDRTFYITGWQLEASKLVTPFEHRSYGEELALCQRYFISYPYVDSGVGAVAYAPYAHGHAYSSDTIYAAQQFPTTMRVAPTFSSTGGHRVVYRNQSDTGGSLSFFDVSQTSALLKYDSTSTPFTVGEAAWISQNNDADARLLLDAEL